LDSRRRVLDGIGRAAVSRRAQLVSQLLACVDVAIEDDRDGSFLVRGSDDGRANSLGAASHKDNFVVELQIHDEPLGMKYVAAM